MKDLFPKMIQNLRKNQEVILFDNIFDISEDEKQTVIQFLGKEYENECLNYPFEPPIFNPNAALWAAEYVYIASQLMLYRQNKESELQGLLPQPDFESTPETILSVDLCFRFIPDILVKLKLIDKQDYLIQILEKDLHRWHYSGVNYVLNLENEDLNVIFENNSLKQLYVNRIIAFKNKSLSNEKRFNALIVANFGIYREQFWKDFVPFQH